MAVKREERVMNTGTPPVKHWCQYKQRPCEYANSWGKCLMTACVKHGDERLIYTTTCNQTCNKKQVASKLESAENATSESEESTMGQPKSKLDYISRADAIEAVDKYYNPSMYAFDTNKIKADIESLPPVTPTEQTDCTDFIKWLLEEVMDEENWELNAVANGEIICRKLKKLGLLEVKDGYYVRASVTPTEQNEEDILKFYYVESLDEYWIGQRCGTRYYGKWTGNCFTYGYSRYLPWGEHVVAPDTLWKEHTYPSEPKEIPFNEWLQGFLEKECQTERTGEWIINDHRLLESQRECSSCGGSTMVKYRYCPNCGAKMGGDLE